MGVAGSAAEETGQGEIQDFVPAGWPKSDVDARLWTRDEIGGDRDALFYTLTADALAEIAAAISFCKANALTIDTIAILRRSISLSMSCLNTICARKGADILSEINTIATRPRRPTPSRVLSTHRSVSFFRMI